MPVVVPLSEKPQECLHLAYEAHGLSTGTTGVPEGKAKEWRTCSDCGAKFHGIVDGPPSGPEEKPGQPPKAVYGHAQVVTYQTSRGQYDLVVGELAMVSLQNGLVVVQHHDAPVVGIVGVRPWLEEDHGGTDAEG
jgi:hypothetical protein